MQFKELPPECFEYRFVRYETTREPFELNDLANEGWVIHEKVQVQQPMHSVVYFITLRRVRKEFRELVIIEPETPNMGDILKGEECQRSLGVGKHCILQKGHQGFCEWRVK